MITTIPIIVLPPMTMGQLDLMPMLRRIGVAVAMILGCFTIALGQFDRANTGTPTAGATANYRFADPNELPITVTLLGAVQRPGRYEISRKIDLVNLLAVAGGWLEAADLSDVRISRVRIAGDPGSRNDLRLDLEDVSEISPKFLQLQEGDYVYIGTSKRMSLPTILSIVSAASAVAVAVAYLTLAKK